MAFRNLRQQDVDPELAKLVERAASLRTFMADVNVAAEIVSRTDSVELVVCRSDTHAAARKVVSVYEPGSSCTVDANGRMNVRLTARTPDAPIAGRYGARLYWLVVAILFLCVVYCGVRVIDFVHS